MEPNMKWNYLVLASLLAPFIMKAASSIAQEAAHPP